jgi:hypothetical protein
MIAATVERVTVTPEMAHQWVARTRRPARRHPIHLRKVAHYAQLMRDGLFCGEDDAWPPIMLDRDGYLINGLQRVSAVCESGCTITFNVAVGFPSQTAAHVRSRNIPDR